jgi:rhodanese-related sulfurtransferase
LRSITASELKKRLSSGDEHAILDVRREGEFAQGHLFFASNVPRSTLELKIERLVPRKSVPITLYGSSEAEAEDAARSLEHFGYDDIAILRGGTEGWIKDGGQLFGGLNVPSKAFGEFVEHASGTPHIAPQALHDLLERKSNMIVLDSRPFAEYQNMNIPGSLDCPGAELVARIDAYLRDPETLVVVNCAGRTRSIMGAQSLIDAGIPNRVVALRDGTMGWHLAGFSLERGQTRRAGRPSHQSIETARRRAEGIANRANVQMLDSDELEALLSKIPSDTRYVFDVRDPEEYLEGHRVGVISAPGAQLVQTFDTLVAVRNAFIVVTDDDGTRAPITAAWLKQMGEKNVVCAIDKNKQSKLPPPMPPGLSAIAESARKIEPEELQTGIAANQVMLIDIANSKEYARAHIEGALFCERHELEKFIRDADGRMVVLTSPDGLLATVAAADRQGAGYNLAALNGGTAAWKNAGRKLENGRGNLPDNPSDVYYRPYDLSGNQESAMQAYLDWEKDLLAKTEHEPGVSFWRAQKEHENREEIR